MTRAARFDRFGAASVISVVDAELPHPEPHQVRVRVKAVGLNPVDYKMRQGTSRHSVTLPSGIGRELAGTVDDLGEGVTGLRVGDAVFGTVHIGALADYAIVPAGNLARKPAELDWIVAGCLALAGQTAYDSFASQSITAADTILVSAAAGGVGSVVAQLGIRAGATVIGTAGTVQPGVPRRPRRDPGAVRAGPGRQGAGRCPGRAHGGVRPSRCRDHRGGVGTGRRPLADQHDRHRSRTVGNPAGRPRRPQHPHS